jgi:Plasmid pRiA4b ORF-3-like protein
MIKFSHPPWVGVDIIMPISFTLWSRFWSTGIGFDRMMHVGHICMLDAEQYDVRHVMRKRGDRIGSEYDLGDGWWHIISVLDIVDKGSVLTRESVANDLQILRYLIRQKIMLSRSIVHSYWRVKLIVHPKFGGL